MLEVNITTKLKQFELKVDFCLEKGCLGILGASGAGKSTILKCIAGIMCPDKGYIRLNGSTLFDSEKGIHLSPQKRKIGYLFQSYALFPNMTVEENIRIAASGKGKELLQEELMERFGLSDLRNQYPNTLSGGEQQRCAFARMLVTQPDMILLDEPFSALDYYLKEELQMEFQTFMKSFKKPVIMVSHSRDELFKLTSELLILNRGEKKEYGETKTLFQKPRTCETARLTGCKNISPLVAGSKHQVKALDWGIDFPMQMKENSLTPKYIGIRAHHFSTIPAKEDDLEFPVTFTEINEAPFEWNILFHCNNAENLKKSLWWKVSKEIVTEKKYFNSVEKLYLSKDKLLFLE